MKREGLVRLPPRTNAVTLPEGMLPPDPFALFRAFQRRQAEPHEPVHIKWNVIDDWTPPPKPKKARRPRKRTSLAASIWPKGEPGK